MKYERFSATGEAVPECQYEGSRQVFRAPAVDLDAARGVFLGGAETFGRFLPDCYAERVAEALGLPCANLGMVNAGLDAVVRDEVVMAACRKADWILMEVLGAANMSNRFYRVHPLRNDRLVAYPRLARRVFSKVDFTDITFVGHLFQTVAEVMPDRLGILISEVQTAWIARMKRFLSDVERPVYLLWLSERPLAVGESDMKPPALVTGPMIEELRPLLAGVSEVVLDRAEVERGRDGLLAADPVQAGTILGTVGQERAEAAVLRLLDVVAGDGASTAA